MQTNTGRRNGGLERTYGDTHRISGSHTGAPLSDQNHNSGITLKLCDSILPFDSHFLTRSMQPESELTAWEVDR